MGNMSQYSPVPSGPGKDDARRVGPPQYIGHQPENMISNNNHSYNSNVIPHDRSPMLPKNPSSGGRNSQRMYDERSEQSKLGPTYSLDEYSQCSDSSNGGTYSDGSSSNYERRERHERQGSSGNGRRSSGSAHYQDGGGAIPRRNSRQEFNSRDMDRESREVRDRANLSYISESYGDDSTM